MFYPVNLYLFSFVVNFVYRTPVARPNAPGIFRTFQFLRVLSWIHRHTQETSNKTTPYLDIEFINIALGATLNKNSIHVLCVFPDIGVQIPKQRFPIFDPSQFDKIFPLFGCLQ